MINRISVLVFILLSINTYAAAGPIRQARWSPTRVVQEGSLVKMIVKKKPKSRIRKVKIIIVNLKQRKRIKAGRLTFYGRTAMKTWLPQAGTYRFIAKYRNRRKNKRARRRSRKLNVVAPINGNVFHVRPDGSGDFTTIKDCAAAVVAGDTCLVHAGTYDEKIFFSAGQSGTPDRRITFRANGDATMPGFYTANADYLRIEGFRITNSLTDWNTKQGIYIRSNYVEVVNNYFYEIKSAAVNGRDINGTARGIYLANNRIYRCSKGFNVAGKDWVVENNEVERLYDWGSEGFSSEDNDNCRFFGENHIIRNNLFHGTLSSETGDSHVDCFQTFDNNTDGDPIQNILIENNRCLGFFHQGFMGSASTHNNTHDIVFKNNIFAHGGSWGASVHEIKNVVFFNNVFADIGYHGIGLRDGATGTVKNNIFYEINSSYWSSSGGKIEGDYNLIYEARDPSEPGPHDIIGLDPLFVDLDNNNFALQAGSPAIDAGVKVSVDTDISGVSRPQDGNQDGQARFDIGAYEYK
jgi:hypothetical protein